MVMNGLLSLSVSDLTALKEALRTGRVHAPFLPTLIERIVPRAVSGDVSAALQAMAAAGTNREGLVAALELLAAARAQQPSIDEVFELVTTGPEAGTVTNLKRHGRIGITRELPLPERITPLVKVYRHEELAHFFAACSDAERALFATFLLSGFREQEVMYLNWSDVNFELRTVRVTAKPNLGFYPKRWEDREVPAPVELLEELRKLTHHPNCQFVFPSPTGNREQHMLDHCKAIAMRAELDPTGLI